LVHFLRRNVVVARRDHRIACGDVSIATRVHHGLRRIRLISRCSVDIARRCLLFACGWVESPSRSFEIANRSVDSAGESLDSADESLDSADGSLDSMAG